MIDKIVLSRPFLQAATKEELINWVIELQEKLNKLIEENQNGQTN